LFNNIKKKKKKKKKKKEIKYLNDKNKIYKFNCGYNGSVIVESNTFLDRK